MLKGITYQIVLKLISEIFELIIPRVSNHIRELLTVYIKDLYQKAKATENIFDDYAVELIASILQIDLTDNSIKENVNSKMKTDENN
jgi:hypothetical protein